MSRSFVRVPWLGGIALAGAAFAQLAEPHSEGRALEPGHSGVAFTCETEVLLRVKVDMADWLRQLRVKGSLIKVQVLPETGTLLYTLSTPESDTSTLDLRQRKDFGITDDEVSLPAAHGKIVKRRTVSQKEILLSMMQHGRLTEFSGPACTVRALKEQVGVRQNIAAWAQKLNWGWPDGGPAVWHARYWQNGVPLEKVALHDALQDMFFEPARYQIGCYTGAKVVYAHAILDYYRRVLRDPAKADMVAQRLMADKDPLVSLEPGQMWSFEADFDPTDQNRPGKLLRMVRGVAPKNFVAGDWSYLLNTDPATSQKTGYEGSNAIYLGRGYFGDYYNDNQHRFTLRQKLDEVYQWRNHVFSRTRDAARIERLPARHYEVLGRAPAQGGLLLDLRVSPYLFGYESLPAYPVPVDAARPDEAPRAADETRR